MKIVSDETQAAWTSGIFVGERRAVTRVTVLYPNLTRYRKREDDRSPHYKDKIYTSMMLSRDFSGFSPPYIPIELPGVRSVDWSRGIDSDVGSCTVTMTNNKPLDIGLAPVLGEFDQPGYYSPYRGEDFAWPYTRNEWNRILLPDRIMRVYQGYGFDPELPPERDPNMVLTGTWLIDDVAFTADQKIRITARDVGRVLLEHHLVNPTVPSGSLPLSFYCVGEYFEEDTLQASWKLVTSYRDNSADPWMGGSNLPINGHYPAHSADGKSQTYWLSFGNAKPNAPYSYEWVQFAINRDVNAVRVHTKGHKKYVMYVSIYQNGKWQGDKTIPYDPNHPASFPNGAKIRYVKKVRMNSNDFKLLLPKKYNGATRIRLTFTNLWHSGYRAPSTAQGGRFPYRAAVARVWTASNGKMIAEGTPKPNTGNIKDYSHIVGELCAYGGFWWPPPNFAGIHQMLSDSTSVRHVSSISGDLADNLGSGSVWGVIEPSFTCPVVPLGPEIWHAKSIMDGILYVKEILGFNFFIDDNGGVVFRRPNLFEHGNYLDTTTDLENPYPSTEPVRVDLADQPRIVIQEDNALLSYEVTLSSRNVREYIRVGSVDGRISATSTQGNPFGSDFRRLAMWTDQHFGDPLEAQVMADKIAQRIVMQSTTSKMRIVAHPGIQIDDQIEVVESVTSELSVHYVRSISSSWDSQNGYWYYDLETNNLTAMGIDV